MNGSTVMMMSCKTSMKVGGPAEYFEPSDETSLILRVRELNESEIPFFLLGNGTNVIVHDKGYPGEILSTLKALRGMRVNADGKLSCGAGESFMRLCRFAAENGLSGLEALSGIPGTVGGAVYMNAGAYEYDIASCLVAVRCYDIRDGNIITLTGKDCAFGYRSSVFMKKPMVILSAEFELQRGEKDEIRAEMAKYGQMRNEKQPVDMPSAGSFFKRPAGDYAGRLIDAAGMKGVSVGGAQVSEKHAGFIVNTGGATAEDVFALADAVKKKVYAMFGVELEVEPVVIGNRGNGS